MFALAIFIYFSFIGAVVGWAVIRHRKDNYLLKVTCNDLVVLQTELIELEAICESSKTGTVTWRFDPPSGTEQPNKVLVQVVRHD